MLPQVTFLGHASVLIETGGVRVLTDPILVSRVIFLGRVPQALVPADYADIDVVLISHMHHDHCDLRSLRLLRPAVVLAPRGAGEYLKRKGISNVREIGAGETYQHRDVSITALPAVHDGYRVPFGPRTQALGYMVASLSSKVYFAGDTDVFSGMADFATMGGSRIDLALMPVWGWGPNLGPGHMNPIRAVEALKLLDPSFAVPIHWGTLFPYGLRRVRPSLGSLLQNPPREFVQLARSSGVAAQVEVVEPGDPVVFAP